MPVPPPPPPAPAPAPASRSSTDAPIKVPNKSALLKSIEKGKSLRKTVTNDRSAPLVSGSTGAKSSAGHQAHSEAAASGREATPNGGGLGGLFANGFPKLRSAQGGKSEPSMPNNFPLKKESVIQNATSAVSKAANVPKPVAKVAVKAVAVAPPDLVAKAAMKTVLPAVPLPKLDGVKKDMRSVTSRVANIHIAAPETKATPRSRWEFPDDAEKSLPSPRKFQGDEKVYLSKMGLGGPPASRKDVGHQDPVSKEDVGEFIRMVKKKLNSAIDSEDFEECVRLKSKLKKLELLHARIKNGEQVYPSELPK